MKDRFAVGEWVEVRSKEEILRTLDSKGQLDGMPFMPEMFQFCGKQFQIHKSAHKTCDPDYKSRRVHNAVHLQTRCDGQAHGGCQAGCLLFWKDAWLKPVVAESGHPAASNDAKPASGAALTGCTEAEVWNGTRAATTGSESKEIAYVCQTTQVQYHEPLNWWDVRQYFKDYRSGNVTLWRIVCGSAWSMYFHLSEAGIGVGRAMRWFYNIVHPLGPGTKWLRARGTIPQGQPTPTVDLNLQPGELVRVKTHADILSTLDDGSKNRGLWWDAELVPYCGKTFRVASRVHNVLDEKTGKMIHMKSASILLDSAICAARYSPCRMFCPRETYCFWREIWLERVEAPSSSATTALDGPGNIVSSRQ